LYDTTLRDGTQGEDVSFSAEDKIKIAKRLDAFGVSYIEVAGLVRIRKIWNSSNARTTSFTHAKSQRLVLHAVQKFCREGYEYSRLLDAQTPVVTIFGKTWLLHVKQALQISPDKFNDH